MTVRNNPIDNPVRTQNGIGMRGELWTCSPSGVPERDLTEYVAQATVRIEWDGKVKMSLNVDLLEPVTVRPLLECLMPIMVLTWLDDDQNVQYIEEPLGVYYFMMPNQTVSWEYTVTNIVGMDALWRMAFLTANALKTFNPPLDHGLAARYLLANLTDVPLNLPDTGTQMTSKKVIRPNDKLLEKANELYDTANYWDIAADRFGTLTTSEKRTLGTSLPHRILVTEDVTGDIRVQPDTDSFCNQVYLSSNSPDADLTMRDGYKLTYTDPDSPFAVRGIESVIVSKEIADSRDESFPTMQTRCMQMLETAAGTQVRYIIPHMPDPRFRPHEAWELDIQQFSTNVVAKGMFRVEAMDFAFDQESAAQATTLSQLVDTSKFAEG